MFALSAKGKHQAGRSSRDRDDRTSLLLKRREAARQVKKTLESGAKTFENQSVAQEEVVTKHLFTFLLTLLAGFSFQYLRLKPCLYRGHPLNL